MPTATRSLQVALLQPGRDGELTLLVVTTGSVTWLPQLMALHATCSLACLSAGVCMLPGTYLRERPHLALFIQLPRET